MNQTQQTFYIVKNSCPVHDQRQQIYLPPKIKQSEGGIETVPSYVRKFNKTVNFAGGSGKNPMLRVDF